MFPLNTKKACPKSLRKKCRVGTDCCGSGSQHFKWNRIKGLDDQKLKERKKTADKFYWSKNAMYLSLGLLKECRSYRRSLQPSKENIKHFTIFYGSFSPPGSGSTTLVTTVYAFDDKNRELWVRTRPALWNRNRNRKNRNFLTSGTGTVTCWKVGTGTRLCIWFPSFNIFLIHI